MQLSDSVMIMSASINLLAFSYGCILKIAVTMFRRRLQNETACIETLNDRKIYFFSHIVAKAVVNIVSGFGMIAMALYLVVTTDVCNKPFFAFNKEIMFAASLLMALCIFNMVLSLLTESMSPRNVHEIPVCMVKALVSLTILVKEEDAIFGVICLLMFGSVLSDELLNLRCVGITATERSNLKLVHAFRLWMLLLCNIVFPTIILFVSACYSQESLFEMCNSSITTFFIATTFFLFCNGWRLKGVLMNLCDVNTPVATEHIKEAVLHAKQHSNAAVVLTIDKKFTQLVKFALEGLLSKKSDNFLIIDGIQEERALTSPNVIYKPTVMDGDKQTFQA